MIKLSPRSIYTPSFIEDGFKMSRGAMIKKAVLSTLKVYIYVKENLDRGPREDYPARG